MPFYERLIKEADRVGVSVVFASTEASGENANYLRAHALQTEDPVSTAKLGLEVRGTPMIIITRGHKVDQQWLGKLGTSAEQEVFDALSR
jgi:hypothetical protein